MDPKDVLTYLAKIPLFKTLIDEGGRDELYRLVPYVRDRTYLEGEKILVQDEVPDQLCLVIEGQVRLKHREEDGDVQEVAVLKPGGVFGRTSLEVGDWQDVTAVAISKTRVLSLHFRELIRIYQKSDLMRKTLDSPLQPKRAVELLKTVSLFSDLDTEAGVLELYRVAEIAHEQVYGNGEWLFQQGETSDRLMLMLEGQARLTRYDADGLPHHVGWLEKGQVAGSTGLLVGDFHDVLATAAGHARVLYVLREDFEPLLAHHRYLRQHLNTSSELDARRKVEDFDWLRDDEWVVSEVQRHWTRLLRQIMAPFFFFALLSPIFWALLVAKGPLAMVMSVAVGLMLVVLVGVIAWRYLNWRDDFFILTTQRVVHIERVWPFEAEYEESLLKNIEDIYEAHPTFTSNVLDYGNLVLQTAGETIEIDMDYLPHPSRLRALISQQIERSQARELLRSRGQIRDLLAQRLQTGVTPPAEVQESEERPDQRRPFFLRVVFTWIWDYLFPPSWVNEGGTIIWRRFWLLGVVRYLAIFVPWLLLAVGGAAYLIQHLGDELFMAMLIGWLVVEVVLLGALLWFIEDWRNDYFQLTRSHIVLVQRTPLLLRESRREARLDNIQNLGFSVPSMFTRLLNCGHVYFETAGHEGRFELKWVRNPAGVKSVISDRQYEYNQRQQSLNVGRRRDELLTWFSAYDNLRKEYDSVG